jgi:hypothetical protein
MRPIAQLQVKVVMVVKAMAEKHSHGGTADEKNYSVDQLSLYAAAGSGGDKGRDNA